MQCKIDDSEKGDNPKENDKPGLRKNAKTAVSVESAEMGKKKKERKATKGGRWKKKKKKKRDGWGGPQAAKW